MQIKYSTNSDMLGYETQKESSKMLKKFEMIDSPLVAIVQMKIIQMDHNYEERRCKNLICIFYIIIPADCDCP